MGVRYEPDTQVPAIQGLDALITDPRFLTDGATQSHEQTISYRMVDVWRFDPRKCRGLGYEDENVEKAYLLNGDIYCFPSDSPRKGRPPIVRLNKDGAIVQTYAVPGSITSGWKGAAADETGLYAVEHRTMHEHSVVGFNHDGTRRWHHLFEDKGSQEGFALSGGTVFTTAVAYEPYNYIFAIDAVTGSVREIALPRDCAPESMDVADGILLAGGVAHGSGKHSPPRFFAVDTATGELLWDKECKSPAWLNALEVKLHNGKGFVFVKEGGIFCVDPRSGEEIWSNPFGVSPAGDQPQFSTPILFDDDAFYIVLEVKRSIPDDEFGQELVTAGRYLTRVNQETGRADWVLSHKDVCLGSPGGGKAELVLYQDFIFAHVYGGPTLALDKLTGEVLARVPELYVSPLQLETDEGVLFIGRNTSDIAAKRFVTRSQHTFAADNSFQCSDLRSLPTLHEARLPQALPEENADSEEIIIGED